MLEQLGEKLVLHFSVFSFQLSLDIMTILMSWIVMLVLVGFAAWLRRGLNQGVKEEPSSRLVVLESLMDLFDEQLVGGFESEYLRNQLFSFISTLLLFLLLSNWLSVIPVLSSPTRDLNIPFSFAILVFIMSHYYGAKINGTGRYLKSFFEPYPFMAPLNIFSEIAKPLSHAFRLFGNVFGGAVLITVVMSFQLLKYFLPAFFQMFYGLFIGAIQAFVFVLLAVAYINVAVEQ